MASFGTWIDATLAAGPLGKYRRTQGPASAMQWLQTPAGNIRFFDSGGDKPCVVMTPDGPNVIEHYQGLFDLLAPQLRVVCFDMPGFGFSAPARSYDHSLDNGAAAIIAVLDHLEVGSATLAMSCANGFYALRVAQLAPQRVSGLLLSQTPSMQAMQRWTGRVVPKPLAIPVIGKVLSRFFRRKMADSWYRIALPKTTDGASYKKTAGSALRCGACFSLAGVVQGLMRESPTAVQGTKTPCTVLWGTLDRSHRLTDPLAILLDAPHAEVHQLEDCGHFPDLENPQRFVQLLFAQVAKTVQTAPQPLI